METGMMRWFLALTFILAFGQIAHAEIVQMTPVVDLSDAKTSRVYTFKYDTDRRVLTVDALCPGLGIQNHMGSPTAAPGGAVNRLGPYSSWTFHVTADDLRVDGCEALNFTAIINEQNHRLFYFSNYSIYTNPYAQEITPALVSLSPDQRFVMMRLGLDPRLVKNRDMSPAARFQIYTAEGDNVFGDFYVPGYSQWTAEGLSYAKIIHKLGKASPSLTPNEPTSNDQAHSCSGGIGWLLEWYLFDGKHSEKSGKPLETFCTLPPGVE